MKILSTKKYNELVETNKRLAKEKLDLTLDNADKDEQMNLYNQQVNILMGKVEDLTDKLEKKSTELKNLKLVLRRNKIDYKALLKEKCPLQKKVEKLAKEMNIK